MFTGLIQAVGEISAVEPKGVDRRLRIRRGKLPEAEMRIGDSIAVNGVCLTAIDLQSDDFAADASAETLQCTTLGVLRSGARVNLELALTPTTHLGGHLVSGHVDGVGEVIERHDEGRSVRLGIRAPRQLARYIAAKGSICVDGVSLTVNSVSGTDFGVNIVPHTLNETTIGVYRRGTRVNLEVDIIARYLERLLLGEQAWKEEAPKMTETFLANAGFTKGNWEAK